MKACKQCFYIVEEGDKCPLCDGPLSREWQGYVIILNWRKSEIAKKMGVRYNGKYALRVR